MSPSSASATGGGACDPRRAAQDLDSKLGKILASQIDRPGEVRWETALYGLRHPWRSSFDTALTEMWVADVGQDEVEEIDRIAIELDEQPKDLGWSAYEGAQRIRGRDLRGRGELVWPVVAYGSRLLGDRRSRLPRQRPAGALRPLRVRRLLHGAGRRPKSAARGRPTWRASHTALSTNAASCNREPAVAMAGSSRPANPVIDAATH